MEPAFLLQFNNNESFNLVVNISLLEQSFGKAIFVKALEDVLLSDISEYLNDFVYSVVKV